ncbi:thioredoxin family protein [Dichotomicrobium thermohalophilum]|uniref:Thioredoxin domain-containing protein n=1 Tax=Dichotomicrobium thermohalophilum TaxID=933063 RepID=A0A397Q0Y1_9HYPH|nr:thioredoxin family protein [Dichotomicrobium thermohalophilum]RIA55056.1 hypothetical protein BXY53_0109 [Dichotomicrobium thermohalophilum]
MTRRDDGFARAISPGVMLRQIGFLLLLLFMGLPASVSAQAESPDELGPVWFAEAPEGERRLKLYFFYSQTCPHCADAEPVVREIAEARPWLELEELAVEREANERFFFMLSREFGREPEAVPTFFLCGEMLVGFDNASGMGARIARIADQCHARLTGQQPESQMASETPDDLTVELPLFGKLDAEQLSLPALTLVLGGLDAFNPCAFFVLLSLLSLMVHAKSRLRIAIVGGVFVFFSAAMYFVFMAAWLNLFLVLQNLQWITVAAGLVALGIGALSIKDYVYFGQGPSLSIPESAKPGLFERMRRLIGMRSLAGLLAGTVVLAIAANSYELLCTSGFPLVYTKVLTMNDLPSAARYAWLALYNIVYVIPLLLVVVVFTATLGARRLSETEGRTLKLVSGLMMAGMGVVLILAPELLHNVLTALALLAAAVILTAIVRALDRRRAQASGR